MIELLFVALFQAAAGDPAASQAPITEAPAATAPAQAAAPAQPAAPPAHQYCRREQVTGTRLTRRICRSEANLSFQDQQTTAAIHDLQRPQGTNIGN